MRILVIRHADPDYEIDGLTDRGRLEAELLADRLINENISAVYCSTLGRARLTAEPTVKRLGVPVVYCEWLREFGYARVKLPYNESDSGCWDILPEYINTLENIYSPTEWQSEEFIKNSDVPKYYREVCEMLDVILARHGYTRDGYNYRAITPNHDTIVFVCHYGITGVLLSHIMNCSPYTIWQNAVTLPTSITTVYTEERREGIASMRVAGIGDVSHLYKYDIEPSFSARFCECFTDDTRHD